MEHHLVAMGDLSLLPPPRWDPPGGHRGVLGLLQPGGEGSTRDSLAPLGLTPTYCIYMRII